MEPVSRQRANLILELEAIVGGHCWNANMQNRGRGGQFEGQGRWFRYPVTYVVGGEKKKHVLPYELSPEVVMKGYYAFGANHLLIMRALDAVLERLEESYGLEI